MANPLPNHARPNINVVMEELSMRIKIRVDEVNSSMDEVYKVMVRMEVILETKVLREVAAIAKR